MPFRSCGAECRQDSESLRCSCGECDSNCVCANGPDAWCAYAPVEDGVSAGALNALRGDSGQRAYGSRSVHGWTLVCLHNGMVFWEAWAVGVGAQNGIEATEEQASAAAEFAWRSFQPPPEVVQRV